MYAYILITSSSVFRFSLQSSRSVGERPQTGRDEKVDGRKGDWFVGAVQKVTIGRVQTPVGRRRRCYLRAGQVGRHFVQTTVGGRQVPVGLLDGKTRNPVRLCMIIINDSLYNFAVVATHKFFISMKIASS